MTDRVKVVLVEDDEDFVFLIQKMISQNGNLDFLGYALNRESGVKLAQKLKPNIVVMDLNLSGSELDGIEAAREVRLTTAAKVLLLTSYEQPEIIINACKRTFASGYIFKSQCQTLADIAYKTAVSSTPQGQLIKELILSELTTAERSILKHLLKGDEETQISSSLKTIANQKTSIFRKLHLKNTNELLRVFRDL